ncbi:MAG: hypothetical protein CL521_05980 [Actinobacteria bacterium]|nr:hypothetical protein [Actinomycetota bacterium]
MIKRTFSLWTLLGFIVGIILFGYAIFTSTENYLMFLSVSSLIMVLGGTFAAMMISFQPRYVLGSIWTLVVVIFPFQISPKSLTTEAKRFLEWSKKIQAGQLKAVEQEVAALDDLFLSFATELLCAGYKGEEYRTLLDDFTESLYQRGMVKTKILKAMAAASPSFGMIGTLVGLVIMLDSMGSDVSKIGAGLAVALLTTLYGVLFAQLLYKPVAEKNQQMEQIVRHRNLIFVEGFVALSEGKNIFSIQDRLNTMMDPKHWILKGKG